MIRALLLDFAWRLDRWLFPDPDPDFSDPFDPYLRTPTSTV